MNRERSESERQLLNDVLREDEGARQVALAAFRRARFTRKLARASAVVVVATAATAAVLIWQHAINRNSRKSLAKIATTDSRDAQESVGQHDLPTLTDEQLLASFPPNSCFLAEVDGRQILVFTDPAIEQQVLRSAGLGKAYQTH
jgi:hypothetical protein